MVSAWRRRPHRVSSTRHRFRRGANGRLGKTASRRAVPREGPLRAVSDGRCCLLDVQPSATPHVRFAPLVACSAPVRTSILDQIPTIPPRVLPDDDTPIRFIAWRRFERHVCGFKPLVVPCEIFGFKKKPDTSTALLSDRPGLSIFGSAGEQNLGFCARGSDPHPSFSVSKIGILPALETNAAEEVESRVVIRDQQRKMGDASGHNGTHDRLRREHS